MTTAHAMLFFAYCNPGGWPPNPWNLRKRLLVVLVVFIDDYDAVPNLSIYYGVLFNPMLSYCIHQSH